MAKLMIKQTNNLSEGELAAAKALIKTCQDYDGFYRTPYLSNKLNENPEMPAFFLALEGEDLVGLLTVYADDEEAELCLMVRPDRRRQGIARQLYQTCQQILSSYPITSLYFQTEQVCLDKAPGLLEAWDLEQTDDCERLMGRDRESLPVLTRSDIELGLARPDQVEAIADFQSRVFGESLEVSRRYAEQAVAGTDVLLYTLSKEGTVLASCTVDISDQVNYLYGMAVDTAYQGQGLGTALLTYLINDLIRQNSWDFQLAVEADNGPAQALYAKLGFVDQGALVYLKKRDWRTDVTR